MYQYPSFGQEIQRTAARSTETLGFPQKAVDLIHLVIPAFVRLLLQQRFRLHAGEVQDILGR